MSNEYEAIIEFWLGDVSAPSEALERRGRMWFRADSKLDKEIESRFGDLLARWTDGGLSRWAATPRGRLALIIVLDQFSRNIHRGTERAFDFDQEALALSRGGIDAGMDRSLAQLERMFFYMPFQHAENRDVQQRSTALFEDLARSSPSDQRRFFELSLNHARKHRDLVLKFGRFPHRNRLLGRVSTPEERAYLTGGGKTFGQ